MYRKSIFFTFSCNISSVLNLCIFPYESIFIILLSDFIINRYSSAFDKRDFESIFGNFTIEYNS